MAQLLHVAISDEAIVSYHSGGTLETSKKRLGGMGAGATYNNYVTRIAFTTDANGATSFSFELTHSHWLPYDSNNTCILSFESDGAYSYTSSGTKYSLADTFKFAITENATALASLADGLTDPTKAVDTALAETGYTIKHQSIVISSAKGKIDANGLETESTHLDFNASLSGSCAVLLKPNTTYYLWFYSVVDLTTNYRAFAHSGYWHVGWMNIDTEGTYYKTLTYDDNGGIGGPGTQQVVTAQTFTLSKIKPTKADTNGYTVTLNANGGTVSPTSLTAKDSYTFASWNTTQNGSGYSRQPEDTFSIGSNMTIYAQYNETKGSVTLPTPSRTGYSFTGWGSSSGATSGTPAGNYTPSSSTTLYAIWSANSYTLTFDPKGGIFTNVSANSGSNYEVSKTYGNTIGTLPIVTKQGYTFVNWLNSSGTAISSTTSVPAVNTTYTASWSSPSTYAVIYNANGGSGSMDAATATYDSTFTISGCTYTRAGYEFIGWTTNSDGTDDGYNWTGWSGTWVYVNGQYGIANNTLTLYARWKLVTQMYIWHDGKWYPAIKYVYRSGLEDPSTYPYTCTMSKKSGSTSVTYSIYTDKISLLESSAGLSCQVPDNQTVYVRINRSSTYTTTLTLINGTATIKVHESKTNYKIFAISNIQSNISLQYYVDPKNYEA